MLMALKLVALLMKITNNKVLTSTKASKKLVFQSKFQLFNNYIHKSVLIIIFSNFIV